MTGKAQNENKALVNPVILCDRDATFILGDISTFSTSSSVTNVFQSTHLQRHFAWFSISCTRPISPLDGGSESNQQTGFFDIYHFISNSSGHVTTTVNIDFRRTTGVLA